jgi:putative ABC transport system permease protein
MNTEDHIWNLVTKKLANEASEEELDELNELLKQNPDIHSKVKLMMDWWHNDRGREIGSDDYFLFKRVLDRINNEDHTLKPDETAPFQQLKKKQKTA